MSDELHVHRALDPRDISTLACDWPDCREPSAGRRSCNVGLDVPQVLCLCRDHLVSARAPGARAILAPHFAPVDESTTQASSEPTPTSTPEDLMPDTLSERVVQYIADHPGCDAKQLVKGTGIVNASQLAHRQATQFARVTKLTRHGRVTFWPIGAQVPPVAELPKMVECSPVKKAPPSAVSKTQRCVDYVRAHPWCRSTDVTIGTRVAGGNALLAREAEADPNLTFRVVDGRKMWRMVDGMSPEEIESDFLFWTRARARAEAPAEVTQAAAEVLVEACAAPVVEAPASMPATRPTAADEAHALALKLQKLRADLRQAREDAAQAALGRAADEQARCAVLAEVLAIQVAGRDFDELVMMVREVVTRPETEADALRREVETLQVEQSRLRASVDALLTENTSLVAEVASLAGQVDSLKASNRDHCAAADRFNTTLGELRRKIIRIVGWLPPSKRQHGGDRIRVDDMSESDLLNLIYDRAIGEAERREEASRRDSFIQPAPVTPIQVHGMDPSIMAPLNRAFDAAWDQMHLMSGLELGTTGHQVNATQLRDALRSFGMLLGLRGFRAEVANG